MPFEDWKPGKNNHEFGMLYGGVQLVASYRDGPDHMLVCFATEKEMLRAKTAFEKNYGYSFEPDEIESFTGCHGFWMPVYLHMHDTDGVYSETVKTAESTFLEKQTHLSRLHYIRGTDIKDFQEKLTKAVNELIASRMDILGGHTLN